ncbi:YicC family protein [Breoghania sp. L-A4]|nr:YicC family protein [Breoghania sp. L-A4]
MTGFARTDGAHGAVRWTWELRSVNGKGLDIRLRLPNGFDSLEVPLRKRFGEKLVRGNISVTLTVQREAGQSALVVNEQVLESVIAAMRAVGERIQASPPTLDGILAFRGVLDVQEISDTEEERDAQRQAALASFDEALDGLVAMRAREGAAIAEVLRGHVDRIAALTEEAERCPAHQPQAILARLEAQVRGLTDHFSDFDPQRLHQEAVLLATKADIREELDRLAAHVEAARALLDGGGAVGRKLDFLAQEFNRETNTLCSKSNDKDLTAIGLELKAVVDRLREQIQNLE